MSKAIRMHATQVSLLAVAWTVSAAAAIARAEQRSESVDHELPSVQEMIEARNDVWGDAARAQPDGASYEFFKDLLPPLYWVNAEFRHYPIVLSAPRSEFKARLVSNGSGVNARANKPPMWYEQGAPVTFYVGREAPERFGDHLTRLTGPTYLDGYLPVVQLKYRHEAIHYREEAFAPVEQSWAGRGATLVQFSAAGGEGRVEARIDFDGPLNVDDGEVLNDKGESLAAFSEDWKWNAEAKSLTSDLSDSETAELAIFTKPGSAGLKASRSTFDEQMRRCHKAWSALLARGAQLSTPEPLVNDAWRAMLIGTHMIAVKDRLHYSAGNAYAKLYEGECGDTLRSLMLLGQLEAAPAMLKPLLEFNREATRFHVAGQKLQLLAHFYWLTRDAETILAYEPLWRPSVELILNSRERESGLLPKDNYAGDINEKVYSLNSNANCWKGLRDVAAMLDDRGDSEEAERLRDQAAAYRQSILKAVEGSERRDAEPAFIPIALLADEPAHDPLTSTRTGSYYDLMCPYVIGSEIFGPGSEREDWLLGYLENHGGIAMGMIRSMPHQGQFKGEAGVNPLYGLRYQLALLRRDEREKALTGFYGQLAQGMTRGTFIGGEGSRFLHGDANGRSFYLPPNSTSSASWLVTLRCLLVQDWDLDEDSKPDTLRLLYAAPRRWLRDGTKISLEKAPTAFGPVACRVNSRLNDGYVQVDLTPPPRPVKTLLLRAPLPSGWKVESVEVDGAAGLLLDGDAVDLSGTTKPLAVKFKVKRS
jgi:hypothetical protein